LSTRKNRALQSVLLPTSLRFVLVLHMLALLAQSGLAGEFLSGTDGVVKFHEITGWVLIGICAVQIGLATRAASFWIVIGSVLVLLAEALQVGTGYGRFLRVHIPLGVIVFGVVTWQLVSVLRLKK
jgi:hypothetical protein